MTHSTHKNRSQKAGAQTRPASGRSSASDEKSQSDAESQFSNEKSATAQRELRSANAALESANMQLDHRVRDLRRANIELRNLLDSMPIATIFLDKDLYLSNYTTEAARVFGLTETDIGRPIDHLGSLIRYPNLEEDVSKGLTEVGTVEREVTSQEGNNYISRLHRYRGVGNRIAGLVLTFFDVTDAVRAERARRDSERRLRTVLAELQHRVRNTLAVVKSITQRTAESSDSTHQMASHLAGRLDSFARVQSAVTRNPDAGVDLKNLIADELLAHATHEGEQVKMDGPDVALRPKAAESISLALHELTTNAVKHGALTNAKGRINIDWKANGDGSSLEFNWAESRPNGKLTKSARHGFGMELLTQILPYDLDAKTKVEFEPHGLRFSMDLPLEHVMEE